MRILLWAPSGAGTHYWGPGTSAFRLYKNLNDKNIKVTLIHASDEQGSFPEVYDEQIKLPTIKKKGFFDKLMYFYSAKRWIKKNYHRFDVVHGISAFEYTFRPLLQFSELGVPVFIKITGEHGGFGNNSTLSKFLGIAKRRKLKANQITGYISISSSIETNLISHGVKKELINNIPNGVDIDRFVNIDNSAQKLLREKLGVKNIFTFIYLGGLTFNKRIIEIIEAVNLLKNSGQNLFQLLIVGPDRSDGNVEKEINTLINNYNLRDLISRFEKVDNPETFLQASDVFMLVSRKEGLSNSLLEAMSCGLGTIVTDVSGSKDLIVDNLNGFFTDGTPTDIAQKMNLCILDPQKVIKFGINNREKIIKNYSSEMILGKHIRLFQDNIKDEKE